MLFALMANTHALTLANVPRSHWLYSDFWLPNGWATAAFVVLSGYGVGLIFSVRYPVAERNAALFRRSGLILLVMLASNVFFVGLKLLLAGQGSVLLSSGWWWGLFTLDTEWSISGVLLPTALVLLCGPAMIRWTQVAPWRMLAALVVVKFAIALLVMSLATSPYAGSWLVRFFFLQGFGGFPVLPFVLNGCFGIWLGIERYRSETVWRWSMAVLMLVQILMYLTTLGPPLLEWNILRRTFSAAGRFAWIFFLASLLNRSGLNAVRTPLALVGSFSLSAFVMHRVFLQTLHLGLLYFGFQALAPEFHYAILWLGTLVLTWAICFVRQRQRLAVRARTAPADTKVDEGYLTR